MRRTALAGHALRAEGQAYRPGDPEQGEESPWIRVHYSWTGVALCECGETSPPVDTVRARQQWHREHKEQVRNA